MSVSVKKNKKSIKMYCNCLLVYSAYQIVVEEVNPQRTRRQASSDCYEVIINLFYIHLTSHAFTTNLIYTYLIASVQFEEFHSKKKINFTVDIQMYRHIIFNINISSFPGPSFLPQCI